MSCIAHQARRDQGIRHYIPGYYQLAIAAVILVGLFTEVQAGGLALLAFVVIPMLARIIYRRTHCEAAAATSQPAAVEAAPVLDADQTPTTTQVPLQ